MPRNSDVMEPEDAKKTRAADVDDDLHISLSDETVSLDRTSDDHTPELISRVVEVKPADVKEETANDSNVEHPCYTVEVRCTSVHAFILKLLLHLTLFLQNDYLASDVSTTAEMLLNQMCSRLAAGSRSVTSHKKTNKRMTLLLTLV